MNFIISLFQADKSELINNSGTSSNLVLGCVEKPRKQGSVFSGPSPPFFLFTTFLFQSLSSYLGSEAFCGFLYLKLRTLIQFYPIPKKVSYIAFYTFVPILLPCLFNLYEEYIMRNAGLEEAQAGIKFSFDCWEKYK